MRSPEETWSLKPGPDYEELTEECLDVAVHTWIERQVERYADRTAVSAGQLQLTYRQLNSAANQLADELIAKSGKGWEPVLILLDHSASLVTAMLAVVKAGKATVIIDPSTSRERLDYLREDAGFSVAITDASYQARLRPEEVVLIESDRSSLSFENPDIAVAPESIMALVYTSGSTGQPKAACRAHYTTMEAIRQLNVRSRLTCHDRLSVVQAVAAGTLLRTVYGGLAHGACLAPFDLRRLGVRGLAEGLRAERVTLFPCVGSVFRQFASSLTVADRFPALRQARIGGEKIFASDLELFQAHFGEQCSLRVGMGTTETCEVAAWILYPGDPIEQGMVPLGCPLPEVEIRILDDDGRPVPHGEIGEIEVRSTGVSSGYWKRDALTREKFSSDPDGGRRRRFKTGDLGRLRPDGQLEHHGRRDFQFQIRGNRVEPGEIETALLRIPSLLEAVVVVRALDGIEDALVAYLVADKKPEPTTSYLRQELLDHLPAHMVPSYFVFLKRMPQISTGKINRAALPDLDLDRPSLDVDYRAPASPLEEVLAQLFSELVRVRRIGTRDSFFDLGGQSLQATRLTSRIWDTFESEVSLADFFENPTIAWLASTLTADKTAARRVIRVAELHRQVAGMTETEVTAALQGLDGEARSA